MMNTRDNIKLSILTPESAIFEGYVEKAEFPGSKGRFMVLKNHAPVISSLCEGNVVFVSEGIETKVVVKAGFVRVAGNEIVVCAEV